MNPILLEIPMPIQTPRLLLRHPQSGDGKAMNQAVVESLEHLRPWMPWAQKAPTPEESEESVRRAWAKWILREDLRIHCYERATGELIGGSGLHRIDWQMPKFEIGYWVRKSYEGKGYVTETVNALTRFAFSALNARRVEICCDASNTRSIAVIERLGFEKEAQLRNECLSVDGSRLRDTLIYSRLSLDGLPQLEVHW